MSDIDDFDDLYGSKYFSASDLKDSEPRLKVGKVEVAELREKKRHHQAQIRHAV